MKISALRFLFCAALAAVFALNASAQTQLGRIKAARVTGEVTKVSPGGQTVRVDNSTELTESDVITTGKESSVVLVFENASTVRIGADSRLEVKQFKIDPLAEEIDLATAKKEPTKSITELDLTYGELVGDVKKLNSSSTYSIKTPVGAAGIRGTQFRIVFRPSSDGKSFTFTLSTAEGLVLFTGSTTGSGAPVEVAAEQEVIVKADVAADGSLSVTAPAAAQQISTEAQTQIAAAVAQVEAVVQQLIQTGVLPPPPPVTDKPQLTPGAGGQ
jgi:hypothetical protein